MAVRYQMRRGPVTHAGDARRKSAKLRAVDQYDLLIVGGGINGTGIARDAAGRGLSVLLVDKDDLASHTSSASSKLVHGGLRYLERLEFKLVRESLAERKRLLRAAPHIVRPLEFIMPLNGSSRPAWMIRAGLFLYDRLGGSRILPASRTIRLSDGHALPAASKAFAYWDCSVQDSRLVVLNAIDAAERGAAIMTRTEMIAAHQSAETWSATLRGPDGTRTVKARALVNAAGPWAGQLLDRIDGTPQRPRVRLVKGSHIVVKRLYSGGHAFILQNPDRRVVFAIPFEGLTLVGTTDVDWAGPWDDPAISEEETDYLLATIARNFAEPRSAENIVWTYSGVRTLVDDGATDPSTASRDYRIDLDLAGPPLLSVFGGKLTTYRSLAEKALDRLAPSFPKASGAWTKAAVLPGGEIPGLDVDLYASRLCAGRPGLPSELLARLSRTYGNRAEVLLEGVSSAADLGEHFGAGLYAREVDYLVAHEWARSAEDVLFRRTKLGLHVVPEQAARLAAYLERAR
jgi:glycerol-3-phosphate dehydrogenase